RMQYTEGNLGRTFILRLHDGDRLPEVLETFAAEKKVPSAVCFFLGGVKDRGKVVVGPRDSTEMPPNPVVRLLDGVHEVCGVGTLFEDEKGKPKLHMHASFGRGDNAITGCIRLGIEIWEIGEIVVLEISNVSAYRARDGKTGFEFLEIKKTSRNNV
ncbi:DNA-binding protein, partial [Candidatus Bathyarchaeota archaeon]|nr:DNA-binding protein [Candidatus Bathyarchaeota archaeon]